MDVGGQIKGARGLVPSYSAQVEPFLGLLFLVLELDVILCRDTK